MKIQIRIDSCEIVSYAQEEFCDKLISIFWREVDKIYPMQKIILKNNSIILRYSDITCKVWVEAEFELPEQLEWRF